MMAECVELPNSCLENGREHIHKQDMKSFVAEDSESKSLRQLRWRRRLEILLLSGVILSVCALFIIPTIFYALPPPNLDRVVILI